MSLVRFVGGPKDGELLEVQGGCPAGRYLQMARLAPDGFHALRYEYAEMPADATTTLAVFVADIPPLVFE